MECTKILEKIYTFAASRSLDLFDELSAFDYKKNGTISEISFPRCINQFGLQLSPSQFNILLNEFSRDGYINIENFVTSVKNSNSIISLEETTKNLSCDSELNQLKEILIKRRQTLYDIFRKYDRYNNGKVPSSVYYTEFGFGPLIKKIVSSYEMDGRIDYIQMQKDIQMPDVNGESKGELPQEFYSLAQFVNNREIDLRQILSRFASTDNLSAGQLSSRSFISFISSIGINFDPGKIESIISFFRLANGNYDADKFCFLIEKAGLQSAVQANLQNKTIHISQQRLNSIDPLQAFENIKGFFKSHRIKIHDVFSVFDNEGLNGIVEEGRFIRLFQQNLFNVDKLELIQAASLFPGDRSETVNYHQFAESIEDRPATAPITAESIIEKVKSTLKENRKHVRPLAARYDKEHSCSITINQLYSVLQMCHVYLANFELLKLCQAFPGAGDKTINWLEFSNEVDPVEPDVAQAIVNQKAQYLESAARKPTNRQIPENVENAIRKVAIICSQKNIELSPLFVRLDTEFVGALHQMKFINFMESPPLSIEPSILRVILGFYRLNGSIYVDYVSFCRDLSAVDLTTDLQHQITNTNPSKESNPIRLPSNIPMIVHLLLKRYKHFVTQNARLNLYSAFLRIDPGKTGFVNVSKVQECFNYIGFETSRDEVEATLNTFRDERKYSLFNYYLFVKAVEQETSTAVVYEVTPEVQKEVTEAQAMIKNKLSSRNRNIYMAFNGISSPSISIQMFFERLALMDLALRSAQASALVKKYRIDQSDQIDWRRFCNDVEKCNPVQL